MSNVVSAQTGTGRGGAIQKVGNDKPGKAVLRHSATPLEYSKHSTSSSVNVPEFNRFVIQAKSKVIGCT